MAIHRDEYEWDVGAQHENETDHLGGEVVGDYGEKNNENGAVGFGRRLEDFERRLVEEGDVEGGGEAKRHEKAKDMEVLPVNVVGGGLVFRDRVDEGIACARVLDKQAANADGDGADFA